MSDNPLLDWLRAHPCQGFKPVPHYNADGDMLEWYWKDNPAYADPVVVDGREVGCVMRDFETHEAVGVKVYGVKGMVLGT